MFAKDVKLCSVEKGFYQQIVAELDPSQGKRSRGNGERFGDREGNGEAEGKKTNRKKEDETLIPCVLHKY